MADHKYCKHYEDCDYRNGVGCCPDRCVQFKNKDIVTVVRCKDCKKYNGHRYCTYFAETVLDDDFCSYGERREE